jgi:hypothetical protein
MTVNEAQSLSGLGGSMEERRPSSEGQRRRNCTKIAKKSERLSSPGDSARMQIKLGQARLINS